MSTPVPQHARRQYSVLEEGLNEGLRKDAQNSLSPIGKTAELFIDGDLNVMLL
jgi:hypothetical protein